MVSGKANRFTSLTQIPFKTGKKYYSRTQSGGYTIEYPDLSSCITEGKDLEQAIEMGINAASGWILGEL